MIEKCYWEEGSKQQWTFYANDNSSLDSLSEKLIIDDVLCSSDEKIENLGIKRVNGKIYSGNYVGVCRLKSLNGKNITSTDGREVILKIEPRFPVSVVDMLNALRDDNEFERYLAPQTNRINEAYREIEDLKDNELFHFFENEDPIFLNWNAYTIKKLAALSARLLVVLKKIAGRQLNGWNGRLTHWRLESRCRWQCLRHRHPSILRNIVICLERMTLLMLLNQLLMN